MLTPERILELDQELKDDGVPVVLSQSQAAKTLGVSTRTLSRWISKGYFRASVHRDGDKGRVLITRREVARFLAAGEQL